MAVCVCVERERERERESERERETQRHPVQQEEPTRGLCWSLVIKILEKPSKG